MARPPLDEKIQQQIRHLSREGKSAEDIRRALESFGTSVSGPTIRRYMVAAEPAPAPSSPPLDVAARVAALAPPPAVPAEPPPDLGDGSPEAVIEVLSRSHRELLDGAARAKATNDLDAFARLHRTAGDLLSQIRQIQKAVASQGVDGFHFTREEIDAARATVREKIDALAPPTCAQCGADLRRMWALDGAASEGGPKLAGVP